MSKYLKIMVALVAFAAVWCQAAGGEEAGRRPEVSKSQQVAGSPASLISYTPSGRLTATNVQTGIDQTVARVVTLEERAPVPGPQGPAGPEGAQGPAGPEGPAASAVARPRSVPKADPVAPVVTGVPAAVWARLVMAVLVVPAGGAVAVAAVSITAVIRV